METFRDNIFSRLDEIIEELYHRYQQQELSHCQLRIEASLVNGPESAEVRRHILDTVNIEEWHHTSPRRDSPQNRSSPPQPPVDDELRQTPLNLIDTSHTLLTPPSEHSGNGVGSEHNASEHTQESNTARSGRKVVGGLRLTANDITPPPSPTQVGTRQLAADPRSFPKRRKLDPNGPARLQPSTLDKLVEGIWEQIHKPQEFLNGHDMVEILEPLRNKSPPGQSSAFTDISRKCRQLTSASRTIRALEVMFQAHWIDSYEVRVKDLAEARPDLRPPQHRKMAITEACSSFEWSEKELRNRMAIWKGYREIRDSAGWAALIFSGPGIYRFCKYRVGFDQAALSRLEGLRFRFEVAADTIQPRWRHLLGLLGHNTQRFYTGHPHDWVVSKRKDPIPLTTTYHQWDPNFSFRQLDESILDREAWGNFDPRRVYDGPEYTCNLCTKPQSSVSELNECECFAEIFCPNHRRLAVPVQVFSTEDGRNNGLMACCNFERGVAVGEFVGLITKDLRDVDVMQETGRDNLTYQIWQGRAGNFTRFINHSCQPNCQFQTFLWLGVQRTVVVSKGVPAGKELTVDYSERYWQRLDKVCLCGEAGCRYRGRERNR